METFGINDHIGGDNPYEQTWSSRDTTTTTPTFKLGVEEQPDVELELPAMSEPSQPNLLDQKAKLNVDEMIGPETTWSKLRSAGVSKEDAKIETIKEYNKLVASGIDKKTAKAQVLGDGSVQWDRGSYEKNEKIRDAISTMVSLVNNINVSPEDLVTGNISEEVKKGIKQIGDFGIESGLLKSYDVRQGKGYTTDGIPVSLTNSSFMEDVVASKHEITRSIVGTLVGARVGGVLGAYVGSMGSAYTGRMADVRSAESKLKEMGVKTEKLSTFELNREGAIAAATDGILGKTIELIGKHGTQAMRSLYQSLMGRNTGSAVKTIEDITGYTRVELEQRAQEYAKAGQLQLDMNKPEHVNNMILRNQIENNPSLQGHLVKALEEPLIANNIRHNVKDRVKTLKGVGASTTSQNLLDMSKDAFKSLSEMMGSVRGTLDRSFKDIEIPTEQFVLQANKIRQGLAPFMATIEERSARGKMDSLLNSLQHLEANPTIGGLFKVRTDYGNLLKKIGMFETQQARRSARLGTVDTQSLSSLYHTIDSHIDGIIQNTPYLDKQTKEGLLKLKHDSDQMYAEGMKAMNTQWVKQLSSEGSTAKNSLDKLTLMAKEGRTEYDEIMNVMSKENQDALEHAMVRRALDKAEVGVDGYNLVGAASDMAQLKAKVKNPQVITKIESIESASKIFEQDPVLSMIANNRVVVDKLAKAGLTYDPKASLLYASWSSLFPRLQVAMVDLMEKTPVLKQLAPLNPLYSKIKTSAKEINLNRAGVEAMLKGEKGDFVNFIDRALLDTSLPPAARKSLERLAKEYTRMADQMQANQREVRAYLDTLDEFPNLQQPAPPGTPMDTAQRVRENAISRQEQISELEVAQFELSLAEKLEAKRSKIAKLQNKVTQLQNQNNSQPIKVREIAFDGGAEVHITSDASRAEIFNIVDEQLSKGNYVKLIHNGKVQKIPSDTTPLNRRPIAQNDSMLRGIGYTRPTEVNTGPSYTNINTRAALGEYEAGMDTVLERLGNKNIPGISFRPVGPRYIGVEVETSPGGRKATASFSLEGDTLYANTAGLQRGSGSGNKVYTTVWDAVAGTNIKAQPTDGMYSINQFRMTANMLQYVAKRGEGNPNVLFFAAGRNAQKGVPRALHGQPLTLENANTVARSFKSWINNNVLPVGVNIDSRTSDAELKRIVQDYGNQSNTPFGIKTAKLVRNFMRSGSLVTGAAILMLLSEQEDFEKMYNARMGEGSI